MLLSRWPLGRALPLAAVVGCAGGGGHDIDSIARAALCPHAFVGSPDAGIALQVIALGPESQGALVEDGDRVPLLEPPQGGRVIFAGVRADNVSPCGARLSGALRDLESGQVRLDNRTLNLLPLDGGGAGSNAGDLSTFANIPACPNQWSSGDIHGGRFSLEIRLTDARGAVATAVRSVEPYCAEHASEAYCRCTCAAGYELGQRCPGDGGGANASDPRDGGAGT